MRSALGRAARRAAIALLAVTPGARAQMLAEESATRFPAPAPSEYTNQATVGDIDNDGDLDIIFANGGGFSSPGPLERQRLYVNDGTGVFTDESLARLSLMGLCRGVEMGDVDRDGDLDVVFAQDFGRRPQLYINDGTGMFTNQSTARLPSTLLSSSRAQFGDIDNDGDLDLYLTSGTTSRFTCGQYRVYVNDGDGFFMDETTLRHPTEAVCNNMDCIFGDIDNDFDLDVRTASTGTNNSRLYRNDGTGVFSTVAGVPSDSTCYSYDFGDMDGDGDLDLLGANGGAGTAENLLENDGTGAYTDVSVQISPNPSLDDNDSKFWDWDNDGDLDLIIARLGSGGERTYTNNGAGNFTQVTGVIQVLSDSSLDIKLADFDNDGRLDVITAQGESGSYLNRIYINHTGPIDTIPPTIVGTEQHPDTTDAAGPYVVRALILDGMTSDRNFFDGGIELRYSVGAGPEQSVPMLHSGGQVYRGEIPGQPPATIEYYVLARDRQLNAATGPVRSFTIIAQPEDLDHDGFVGFGDLLMVLSLWGPCPGCPADLDGNGVVDFHDLIKVLSAWS
jgi:hypothetical protein